MNPMSAEATVIRNYIDVALSLPWGQSKEINFDPEKSAGFLDHDHYGLEKVKNRILEYLFIYARSKKTKPPILCLLGAPGVGKTSLAKSIAKASGREFARISLGGVRDEAEIRGHRRTYIGAMPGKIISAMKKVQTSNPVILLDEIDKMSADFRGDPGSALLEVLDQEQNQSFCDHYLDIDYDLSDVIFVATANSLHNVPHPLIDRMEIIQVSGYTDLEKLAIAKQHLLPRCVQHIGLDQKQIKIDDKVILELIYHYTREAGVRNLEREIANLLRKEAKKQIENKKQEVKINLEKKKIQDLLGPHRYHFQHADRPEEVGVAQGMAYTIYGGDLLLSEVAILQGKGTLQASGKLGDVMKESAHAALSYIRLRSDLMGLYSNFYSNIDVHIHFPEGAIPKDGPSAGVTIAVALFSALTQRPIRSNVAMTGEITLRGRVLPVGGIKEKLLAAHRAHIKRALIPKANQCDLHDVPKEVTDNLEIKLIEYVDEAILESIHWKEEDFLQHRIQKNLDENKYYSKTPTVISDHQHTQILVQQKENKNS
jgi:ATP-dependent Lon protease